MIPGDPKPPVSHGIGDRLADRYRLLRRLGEGGMGTVYEAVDELVGGRVAVKLIHPEYKDTPETVARFRREAEATAAAGHEAIVGIFDFGVAPDGVQYLVMEILDGLPLAELLDRRGRLDVSLTAYIGCQTLSGLSAAHRVGVIHRDLKPENIFLVGPSGAVPSVKLLDFGTSLLVGDASIARLTSEGTVIGTPEYMSPEHARGRLDLDGRTDLYSLGIILYECVTGRAPFTARSPGDVLYKVLVEAPVSPRTLRPDIPAEFEELVLWAMDKDRDRRPQACRELFEPLSDFVDLSLRARLIPLEEGELSDEPTSFETRQIDLADVDGLTDVATIQDARALPFPDESERDDEHPTSPLRRDEVRRIDALPTTPLRQDEMRRIDALPTTPLRQDEMRRIDALPTVPRALDRQSQSEMIETAPFSRVESGPGLAGPSFGDPWSPPVELQQFAPSAMPVATEPGMLPRGMMLVALAGAALFVCVAGIAFGIWIVSGSSPDTPPSLQQPEKPVAATAADAAPSSDARPSEEPAPVVLIHLVNTPDGATIYLDDLPVESAPLRLARDGSRHRLRVVLQGFEPFEQEFQCSEDQTITVALTPLQ